MKWGKLSAIFVFVVLFLGVAKQEQLLIEHYDIGLKLLLPFRSEQADACLILLLDQDENTHLFTHTVYRGDRLVMSGKGEFISFSAKGGLGDGSSESTSTDFVVNIVPVHNPGVTLRVSVSVPGDGRCEATYLP